MITLLLKSLIDLGKIKTTVAKAKELRRHADRIITLAKKDTLASKRLISARLRLRYNKLSTKEARKAKAGDFSSYNVDRTLMQKLHDLSNRFAKREGGYTRIMRLNRRVGDQAPLCIIEYLPEVIPVEEKATSEEPTASKKKPAAKKKKPAAPKVAS